MDTQYIFGHDGDAMTLETIGSEPGELQGPFSVTVRTDVDEITHACVIVRKYRSAKGTDGRYYDWYIIDRYFRDTDKTPAIRAALVSAQRASAVTFVVLAEAGSIDNVTAAEHADLFAAWAYPVAYKVGNIREHGGNLYRCLTAHTSQESWTPDVSPSLWVAISDPAEEWPAWSQPIGSTDSYAKGAQVSHNGKHWTSDYDANVWEPGVYGWTEVTD